MKSTYLKCWLVIAFCFFASAGWSQVKKISGKVISGEDAKPLEGVSIIIKNKGTGAQTNTEGVFEIDASSGDVLVVSFTGFLSQEAKVGSSPAYNFSLQPGVDKLDEVVVVGYGTARRSKITSSIAKLDPKVLETGLRSNPAQALAGTIPGLRVSTGTGRPGSLPSIILRGGTNFDGSGSPLIVMDGQVRESLSDINPEDIGSMEVLKDASATAIYGSRGANGSVPVAP